MGEFDGLKGFEPDRNVARFSLKWFAFAVMGAVLIAVVVWILTWLSVPAKIASVDNVKKQWAFAYQNEEALKAIAIQVCQFEQAVAQAASAEEKMQRNSQLLATQNNYARVQADYNAKLRNAFEAKWVKPGDVPDRAPTLEESKAKYCSR